MLVLARRENEKIMINGGEIVITVIEVQHCGKVRLGIEAPREMPVDRLELLPLKPKEEKR